MATNTIQHNALCITQNLFKNLRLRIAIVRSAWRQPNISKHTSTDSCDLVLECTWNMHLIVGVTATELSYKQAYRSALGPQHRYVRWLSRCSPLVSHFEYMPEGTDRQTDGRTPDRCFALAVRRCQLHTVIRHDNVIPRHCPFSGFFLYVREQEFPWESHENGNWFRASNGNGSHDIGIGRANFCARKFLIARLTDFCFCTVTRSDSLTDHTLWSHDENNISLSVSNPSHAP